MSENMLSVIVALVFFVVSFLIYNYMRITIDRKAYSKKESLTRNYIESLGAELLGAGITSLIALLVFQAVTTTSEETRLNLVDQLQESNEAAAALADLRDLGWLVDGSLAGVDLTKSELVGANLRSANLMGADLSDSNLSEADLTYAQLNQTKLTNANLSEARLISANLINADLSNSNLTGASFVKADLTGANLAGANLTGVDFREAIMPDGTLFSDNTDLSSFTVLGFAQISADTGGESALQFTDDPNSRHYAAWGANAVISLYANPVETDVRVCNGSTCTEWTLALDNPAVMTSFNWLFQSAQNGDQITATLRNDTTVACTVWVVGNWRYCGVPRP